MLHGKIDDSIFTKAVTSLVKRIHDHTHVKDSLYEQATIYFKELIETEKQFQFAEGQIAEVEKELEAATDAKQAAKINHKKEKAESLLKGLKREQEAKRVDRYNNVIKICNEILDLLGQTGENETTHNAAKILGTIQLIAPIEGNSVPAFNQRAKHLYKVVLCIKLLDDLLKQKLITNSYVLQKYQEHQVWEKSKDKTKPEYSPFRTDIQIPLIIAALFQDVGHYHPEAQLILKGPKGDMDEFRALNKEERSSLLKISYQQALRYATFGVGVASYRGNSKEERKAFYQEEQEKLKFTRILLKSAINPESGIGNLLKVPQVYCSVVLSTKHNYNYETLPRVKLVMEKGAEVGAYSKAVSDSLIKMTGVFPQGYGVTFIPQDSDRQDLDRYEYGIVVGLYPEDIEEPVCRIATRNLAFNAFGVNVIIGKDNNLYFNGAKKKLERVSEERLEEILRLLWSNYEQRKHLDLIPKCWFPTEYFSYARFQNVWNKASETIRIK
ncbi:hypothetical protein [Alteromonas sp. a30]|uniref:hypothetical protein n=1 Tax=Alteromonas sp. a30 TaxID=2730917 RepID=UPI00227E1413|nr:hypothetical protein [Alteromonas sp. a30]MCY7294796.1 hypothetical protein [Alteromonas sp. a30]